MHLVVKAVGEDGRRLNIRKATLRGWRRDFQPSCGRRASRQMPRRGSYVVRCGPQCGTESIVRRREAISGEGNMIQCPFRAS